MLKFPIGLFSQKGTLFADRRVPTMEFYFSKVADSGI